MLVMMSGGKKESTQKRVIEGRLMKLYFKKMFSGLKENKNKRFTIAGSLPGLATC